MRLARRIIAALATQERPGFPLPTGPEATFAFVAIVIEVFQ